MGLDTSHGCWHGAYSAFHRWRQKIAEVAGLPPLELMEGFYGKLDSASLPTLYHGSDTRRQDGYLRDLDSRLPIKWAALRPDPALHFLLSHSDCEGEIPANVCGPLADRLTELLPLLTGNLGGHIGDLREKTQTFIDGLRSAAEAGEAVDFH